MNNYHGANHIVNAQRRYILSMRKPPRNTRRNTNLSNNNYYKKYYRNLIQNLLNIPNENIQSLIHNRNRFNKIKRLANEHRVRRRLRNVRL